MNEVLAYKSSTVRRKSIAKQSSCKIIHKFTVKSSLTWLWSRLCHLDKFSNATCRCFSNGWLYCRWTLLRHSRRVRHGVQNWRQVPISTACHALHKWQMWVYKNIDNRYRYWNATHRWERRSKARAREPRVVDGGTWSSRGVPMFQWWGIIWTHLFYTAPIAK